MSSDYTKQRPSTIQKMFGSIAGSYDKTNAVLSFSMHNLWNKELVNNLVSESPLDWVDLCAGTGEIAFRAIQKSPNIQSMSLIDFCPEMLEIAKQKPKPTNTTSLSFIQADVQQLPLNNEVADRVSIAYGIRNVKSPLKCIQEIHRILKPGGVVGILELTRPSNTILKNLHKFYLQYGLPYLGKWLTSNKDAYNYLCNSIQHFTDPATISENLKSAGFQHIQQIPLLFGTATIIKAQKEAGNGLG